MNWLRSVLGSLMLSVLARYEGAAFSTSRSRIYAGVQSVRFDAGASTRLELVRKSRYFERNNAIVNRMVDLFECYTVGCGLQMTPSSADSVWNEKAKAWWTGWEKFCDLTSLSGFGTVQGLIARTWFVDGEVFIKMARGKDGTPRIQVIEGHRVGTPPHLASFEGRNIIDGVVIDAAGRPVAYYIADENEKGEKIYGAATPADSVIHIFESSRPGQYRGLPFLYPVINELHDLDDLHMMEMKAAKDAAEITNVIKTKSGEVNAADLIRMRGTVGGSTSSGAAVTESRDDYYQDRTGGRTVVLKTNDDIQQFRSDRPSVVTREYWKYKTELVCAGVGIPYVLVFPESMQGTVYRGALDMADAFFRARSGVLAVALSRIYEIVMRWGIANERTLYDKPGDWWAVSVHAPRSVNVDVGRNSSAMLAELKMGATNYELIYAPLGLDWREQFRKLKEQQDYAAELGLEFNFAEKGTADASQTNPALEDIPT